MGSFTSKGILLRVFSVNPSETDVVVKYITNQDEHHKKLTFQDEFRAFLKKYKVEYDERYVWDYAYTLSGLKSIHISISIGRCPML